jgi:hypothetical protein
MLSVEIAVGLVQAGFYKGPTVLDLAALSHLFEQGLATVAFQQLASKSYEGAMDVGWRTGRGDAVDISGAHEPYLFDLSRRHDTQGESRRSPPDISKRRGRSWLRPSATMKSVDLRGRDPREAEATP